MSLANTKFIDKLITTPAAPSFFFMQIKKKYTDFGELTGFNGHQPVPRKAPLIC